MKLAAIGAVLITLPALVAFIYGIVFGPIWLVYAAVASLSYNVVPFVLVGIMSRRAHVTDLAEEEH
jgi:hypothetical protein